MNGVVSNHLKDLSPNEQYEFNERHRYSWDHNTKYFIPSYKEFEMTDKKKIVYDLEKEYNFLKDHVISGKELFPATGHIYTIWKHRGIDHNIIIKDFKIIKAVPLTDLSEISFTIEENGDQFGIYHDNEIVASGIVEIDVDVPNFSPNIFETESSQNIVDDISLYNFFDRFGYEYKNHFKLIKKQNIEGTLTTLKPSVHIIPHLDNLLQVYINI